MSRRLAAPLLFAALLVAGCGHTIFNDSHSQTTIGSGPYVQGSGKVTVETRALPAFHAISVENGLSVEVRSGGQASAAVSADDNLVAMIVTTVSDGQLTISVEGSLTTSNPLRVTVTAPGVIDSLAQSNGSSVDFESIAADDLTVSVTAGSTLRAGGKAANLTVAVNSGSTADMRNVQAGTAEVHVVAGSTARLNVSDSVTGECTTGSTLVVSGGASIDGVGHDIASTVKRD